MIARATASRSYRADRDADRARPPARHVPGDRLGRSEDPPHPGVAAFAVSSGELDSLVHEASSYLREKDEEKDEDGDLHA